MQMLNPSIYQILDETTRMFMTAPRIRNKAVDREVIKELFGYKNLNDVPPYENFENIDLVFANVIIDKTKAEQYKDNFIQILEDYSHQDKLSNEMNYVELSHAFNIDEAKALRMLAMGKFFGVWDVLNTKSMEVDKSKITELAKSGVLRTSGYTSPEKY